MEIVKLFFTLNPQTCGSIIHYGMVFNRYYKYFCKPNIIAISFLKYNFSFFECKL